MILQTQQLLENSLCACFTGAANRTHALEIDRLARSLYSEGIMKHFLLFVASLSMAVTIAFAQTPALPAPMGAVVNSDHSITFRLHFPGAKEVSVETDAALRPLRMTQDASGLWTAATPALKPDRYGYTFVVDGVHQLDPLNRDVHTNFLDLYSDSDSDSTRQGGRGSRVSLIK